MRSPGVALRHRVLHLLVFFTLVLLLMALRLGYVQLVWGDSLGGAAQDLRTRTIVLNPRRGAIRDVHGRDLAVSVDVDSLYAVPSEVRDPAGAAGELSSILDRDQAHVHDLLTRASSFVWVQRKLSDTESAAVEALDLPGLYFLRESKRVYPKGGLGASVLGFAGMDNQGLEGVEYGFEQVLRGEPGRIEAEFDADERHIPRATYNHFPANPGDDIYLTIDEVLQYVAERALSRMVEEQDASGGSVVLMEPSTGRILAMATHPGFDPNDWKEADPRVWQNAAIASPDHPGSVFKAITAAMAVESGVASIDSEYHDPGYVRVPGATIRNWDLGALGDTDLPTAFAESSNVVFSKIAEEIGKERFYGFLDQFGFGRSTGIQLPGEANGMIPPESTARPVDLAVMSFGQTLTVTPLQMASAVSAIVNGGTLMRPLVVDRVGRGDDLEYVEPEAIRRVVSEETARVLRELMVHTVSEGSGSPAAIAGYRVGGKTGTAQKTVEGRVSEDDFISTFVGFAPAENPSVLCFVAIDEPQQERFGSVVAAPVFHEVVKEALRHLNVPPDSPEEIAPEDSGEEKDDVATQAEGENDIPDPITVPDVRDMPLADALDVLGELGLEGMETGEGERVIQQVPSPGAVVGPGDHIIMYLEAVEGESAKDQVRVPDVEGMSLRRASEALAEAGLRLEAVGSGVVVRQRPRVGERVPRGAFVELELGDRAPSTADP